jgi:predicted component of type VI protein secretion system
VYQRRRNVREPPPPPQNLPTNMITPEVEALPATPKGQMQIKVRVLQTVGSSRQKRESIQTTPFSIGRGRENHVRIASDPNISRKHIEVTASGEAFYVTDTSRNGTYLNDKRQEEGQCSRPLTRRVEVGLGPHTRIELERQDN